MKNSYFALILSSLLLLLFSHIGFADQINILALDESRHGVESNSNGSINFNFATGAGYQVVRDSLFDSSNFGATGVVNHTINPITSVGVFDDSNLSIADIVILSDYTDLGMSTEN
jgi:hypothetical protein